jgi:hypothetical protein
MPIQIQISMTDADSDSDPDGHQNDADPLADPAPSFTLNGKSEFVLLAIFYLSHYCQMFQNFSTYFGQQIQFPGGENAVF